MTAQQDGSRRAPKRYRVSRSRYEMSPAATSLVERLLHVRASAVDIRDAHQELIDDYDARVAIKRAAARGSGQTQKPQQRKEAGPSLTSTRRTGPARTKPDTTTSKLSEPAENGTSDQKQKGPVPRLSAMSLLVEPEPVEKGVVQQSVIMRALTINRRNAELARERLPKQPEAQRRKTQWDYMLDEAMWLANDFREEQKWKMQMAKKVSRMVQQYHSQRESRNARAQRDEEIRMVRIANAMARDVRKFWKQIRELADYRESVVRDAEVAEERKEQLEYLLEQTTSYTEVLASSLNLASKDDGTQGGKAMSYGECGPASASDTSVQKEIGVPTSLDDDAFEAGQERPRKRRRGEVSVIPADAEVSKGDQAADCSGQTAETPCNGIHSSDAEDDERTMAEQEATEEQDPNEVQRLEDEATLSIEDILRQQGIDPSRYAKDTKNYADDAEDSESPDDDNESVDEDGSVGSDADHASDTGSRTRELSASVPVAESEGLRDGSRADSTQATQGVLSNTTPTAPTKSGTAGGVDPASTALNGECLQPKSAGLESAVEVETTALPGATSPSTCAEVKHDGKQEEKDANSSGAPTSLSGTARGAPSLEADVLTEEDQRALAASALGGVTRSDATTALDPPARLLRGSLRSYQLAGLRWLATLYDKKLNGILADEMGLGKTIQTVSLLAWLAVEKGIWGPHLVVVPTSVMINWEVEFKKWLPGFKILTYFGSMKERRAKRLGWSKPNTFHVCITSYSLVMQDATALKRKKWVYLILDEAHNIKNFQSQRWQTLVSFPSRRRLLLTGTPLQNSVMELWALMHFLMPNIFRSHSEFKDWFSKPLTAISDSTGKGEAPHEVVTKLHKVLRPFILRRMKADVEKGLPGKFEHVVMCSLSKRQRQLYEDFMARSDVQDTLDSGDFIGVMNVLMQLRKVCNHPDLFEGRAIHSPFSLRRILYVVPAVVARICERRHLEMADFQALGLDMASCERDGWPGFWTRSRMRELSAHLELQRKAEQVGRHETHLHIAGLQDNHAGRSEVAHAAIERAVQSLRTSLRRNAWLSEFRCQHHGLYGADLLASATMTPSTILRSWKARREGAWDGWTSPLLRAVRSLEDVALSGAQQSSRFVTCLAQAVGEPVEMRYAGDEAQRATEAVCARAIRHSSLPLRTMFRTFDIRSRVALPESRLVQWDCGKLQSLDRLLRQLKRGNHKVLIFTQMTRMLDILETFLNLHSHLYLRLDGSTKADDRQKLVERFNSDPRLFCMILTTRAGGMGLNLTGADTVVFYDTDYNPSIDAQAQDRAHRIGQTKPVHIYRLVSEQTVEENILNKANQKRTLESLVISQAGFTTDGFRRKLDVKNLVVGDNGPRIGPERSRTEPGSTVDLSTSKGDAGEPSNPVRPAKLSSEATTPEPRNNPSIENAKKGAHGVDHQPVRAAASEIGLPLSGDRKATVGNEHAAGCSSGNVLDPSTLQDGGLDMSDIGARLLAAEDEKEREALAQQRLEQSLAESEFQEHDDGPNSLREAGCGDADVEREEDLLARLTPVQRFALRTVELNMDEAKADAAASDGKGESKTRANTREGIGVSPSIPWQAEFSTEEMLRRRAVEEQQDRNEAVSDGAESDVELTFEIDAASLAQDGYLKVLTDIDADIKLYLPLRDDGPEELKLSSVVNGTAAAGLECAEDAAFFPHAYNRMSRTPYATKRQKEKASANLEKKLADEKRKARIRDSAEAQRSTSASVTPRTGETTSVDKAKTSVRIAKAPPTGASKGGATANTTKKARIEAAKSKVVSGTNSSSAPAIAPSGGAVLESASGLFPKTKKPPKVKASCALQGRSGGLGGIAVSKDDVGVNDGWTKAEDQQLLDFTNTFNRNMTLVADAASIHPHAIAGHRMMRGQKRCIDRVKTLAKDMKSGSVSCRASKTDTEAMKHHFSALCNASQAIANRSSGLLRKSDGNAGTGHPSHERVENEMIAKGPLSFSAQPPTLRAVSGLGSLSLHHVPGLRPAECTPAALVRKRRPFIRRFPSDRKPAAGPAAPSRVPEASGPGAGTPTPSGRYAVARQSGQAGSASQHAANASRRPAGGNGQGSKLRAGAETAPRNSGQLVHSHGQPSGGQSKTPGSQRAPKSWTASGKGVAAAQAPVIPRGSRQCTPAAGRPPSTVPSNAARSAPGVVAPNPSAFSSGASAVATSPHVAHPHVFPVPVSATRVSNKTVLPARPAHSTEVTAGSREGVPGGRGATAGPQSGPPSQVAHASNGSQLAPQALASAALDSSPLQVAAQRHVAERAALLAASKRGNDVPQLPANVQTQHLEKRPP